MSSSAVPGPIRVLYVISGLGPGGAEMMLRKLVLSHDRRRVSPAVISCGDLGVHGAPIKAAGVPVWCLHMHHGCPTPNAIVRMARIVRRFRPHLTQSWLYHADILLSLVRFLEPVARQAKWAWNIRCSQSQLDGGWSLMRMMTSVLSCISNRPDVLIANSRAGIAHHRRIGYHPRRWIALPNGFDCVRFRPDPSARGRLCRELGRPAETEFVALIARHDPLKDHENFISSISLLRKRNPRVHAVMAGKGVTEGNQYLIGMVANKGLEGAVSFLGERDDLPSIMAASSVVALSSVAEGFPNVIGEAMACGTPCVVTDVGDSRWMVGRTGIVVPPGSPAELADGIARLLNENPGERRARSALARERILELFELKGIVERYEMVYAAMVGRDAWLEELEMR